MFLRYVAPAHVTKVRMLGGELSHAAHAIKERIP